MIKITGLDKLSRSLDELSQFSKDIDGHIGEVRFSPHDPSDIQRAIAEMEAMIDERSASYSRNEHVQNIASELKERYRQAILEKAAAKRLEGDAE